MNERSDYRGLYKHTRIHAWETKKIRSQNEWKLTARCD